MGCATQISCFNIKILIHQPLSVLTAHSPLPVIDFVWKELLPLLLPTHRVKWLLCLHFCCIYQFVSIQSILELYSPWNSPGQNTGVGSLSLLQGIFPTQGLNPGLPHCWWILYQLSHKGSPRILEWVAYPFSRGSPQPRNWTRVSCITGGFFTNWAMREAFTLNFEQLLGATSDQELPVGQLRTLFWLHHNSASLSACQVTFILSHFWFLEHSPQILLNTNLHPREYFPRNPPCHKDEKQIQPFLSLLWADSLTWKTSPEALEGERVLWWVLGPQRTPWSLSQLINQYQPRIGQDLPFTC